MNKEDILGYFIIFTFIGVCLYKYYDDIESFQLKCIVSEVDGNKYCVREREQLENAVDLLATVTNKCSDLVAYMKKTHPNSESVKRLANGFNPDAISETLPTSKFTAYSENKGEKIAFCLNEQKENNDNLIDERTLTFVAIHELAHIMTISIGHKKEFWENFKFLLENAKEAGIHEPVDYKNKPKEYCSMKINDNPYYDA